MKIAISGAGVAGPALAHWLVRRGHEPTLIEIAPRFRHGGYIVDFWGKGYDLVERMGLLPLVRQAGYRVREVRLVDGQGRRAGGFNTDAITNAMSDRFLSLPRGELAGILYDSVKDRIETLFDESITSIEQSSDRVRVAFKNASPRDFDLLIGADGLHSNVRRLAMPARDSREEYLGYHVAAFEVAGYRPRDELTYVSFARPGRQIARFAMREDRTVFLLIFSAPHPIGTRDAAEQREVLRNTFRGLGWECDAILEAMSSADTVYFDRVSQMHVRRWSTGRVALIGDAAHCPSLLAGEGCALAIIDACVLAGELALASSDHVRAFAEFERRLRRFIEAKQRVAKRFARQFVPRTAFGIWFRAWATRAMALPGVSDLLLGRALRDRLELPDY